jgi:NAD-dependent deacetylase
MPEFGMQIAQMKIVKCDLFITIGTSLVVYPAAGFPKLAKEIGAKLIIINNEPTDYDHMADLVIHQQIGEVFSKSSSRK